MTLMDSDFFSVSFLHFTIEEDWGIKHWVHIFIPKFEPAHGNGLWGQTLIKNDTVVKGDVSSFTCYITLFYTWHRMIHVSCEISTINAERQLMKLVTIYLGKQGKHLTVGGGLIIILSTYGQLLYRVKCIHVFFLPFFRKYWEKTELVSDLRVSKTHIARSEQQVTLGQQQPNTWGFDTDTKTSIGPEKNRKMWMLFR